MRAMDTRVPNWLSAVVLITLILLLLPNSPLPFVRDLYFGAWIPELWLTALAAECVVLCGLVRLKTKARSFDES